MLLNWLDFFSRLSTRAWPDTLPIALIFSLVALAGIWVVGGKGSLLVRMLVLLVLISAWSGLGLIDNIPFPLLFTQSAFVMGATLLWLVRQPYRNLSTSSPHLQLAQSPEPSDPFASRAAKLFVAADDSKEQPTPPVAVPPQAVPLARFQFGLGEIFLWIFYCAFGLGVFSSEWKKASENFTHPPIALAVWLFITLVTTAPPLLCAALMANPKFSFRSVAWGGGLVLGAFVLVPFTVNLFFSTPFPDLTRESPTYALLGLLEYLFTFLMLYLAWHGTPEQLRRTANSVG